MSGSPFLAALRSATGDMHNALEREADVEAGLREGDRRAQTVAQFHDFHRAVETAIACWTDSVAELGFEWRPRSPMIAHDLEALGRAAAPTPTVSAVGTLGEALGWIYVAEGSMLGGRVMRKAMRRDGMGVEGLSFLDPYGDETGPRWQAFIRALETAGARGLADKGDVVTGGRDAFGLAGRLLVPPRELESAA